MNGTYEKIKETTNPIAGETAEKTNDNVDQISKDTLREQKASKKWFWCIMLAFIACCALIPITVFWYASSDYFNANVPKISKSTNFTQDTATATGILDAAYRGDLGPSIDRPSEVIPLEDIQLTEIYAPRLGYHSESRLNDDTEYLFRIGLPNTYRAELENEHSSFDLEVNYTFQAKADDTIVFEVKLYNRETSRLYYGCFEVEAEDRLCIKHEMGKNTRLSPSTLRLEADYLSFSFYTSALPEDGPKVTESGNHGAISVNRSIAGVDQVIPTYPEYKQSITTSDITVSEKIVYSYGAPEYAPSPQPEPTAPPEPTATSNDGNQAE